MEIKTLLPTVLTELSAMRGITDIFHQEIRRTKAGTVDGMVNTLSMKPT
jgi:hypothetical protein